MDSSLEFLGSFDVSDSQGTVIASAEEVDEAQEEELLFSVRCRTRPTPGTDNSGDEEEGKAGDEGVIDAPAPPTKKMKAAKKAAKKPVRETRELPPTPSRDKRQRKSVRDAYKGHSRALLPIPKIIDDYNHHMNGVDIADQLRSYYSTQLRTYRAWAPIFFWLLDTTIINAYLINKLFGSLVQPSSPSPSTRNAGSSQQAPSSTVSSVSTPYSQSNSASQIFEETSFFNQLSSNDSLSREQHQQQLRADQLNREGEYQSSSLFGQNQSRYGLGFIDNNPTSSLNYHHSERGINRDDDDDTDGDHTDKDDDGSSQDESGPLREQIKQLQLEDVLAFLPVGGASASGMLQRPADYEYQRRTASGDKMPFQLDDELANLETKSLEEILGHDGGDEDDGDRVKGIRFKDTMAPSRMRGLGREDQDKPGAFRTQFSKSSAHNSVGSSFSDLSDSSVTQSAMEDAYLSGYNNSKM
ncbi:hypothetical protein KI688_008243 [Linnemannia hyalina]|uniref:PiggyBac transposable element-derived protein domain-containing protein n=1 Tax=Linnemannia hyalina TaxID=64524 RepID=A0A9P8BVP5_9FUNG|nr:hypothetical protein KI688_008243 [Linnemannia hyalina]